MVESRARSSTNTERRIADLPAGRGRYATSAGVFCVGIDERVFSGRVLLGVRISGFHARSQWNGGAAVTTWRQARRHAVDPIRLQPGARIGGYKPRVASGLSAAIRFDRVARRMWRRCDRRLGCR